MVRQVRTYKYTLPATIDSEEEENEMYTQSGFIGENYIYTTIQQSWASRHNLSQERESTRYQNLSIQHNTLEKREPPCVE